MRVKYENGTKDVPLTEVTAENYIVPKGEELTYHVIQEMRKFDQNTGKRLSKPVLQKYDRKVWQAQRRWLESTGHTVTILHDPSKYTAAVVQSKAQSEASRKAAERAAMKAELMRELKAEREAMKAELLAEIKAENAKSEKPSKKSKK